VCNKIIPARYFLIAMEECQCYGLNIKKWGQEGGEDEGEAGNECEDFEETFGGF